MTTKQHRWYLREWGAAFSAHWSGVRGGEVVARTGRPENHPLREQVLAVARRMLGARGGKLNADVIRHACHVVALGKDIGFLPGTEEEKMGPWMGALDDNLEVLARTDASAAAKQPPSSPRRNWCGLRGEPCQNRPQRSHGGCATTGCGPP